MNWCINNEYSVVYISIKFISTRFYNQDRDGSSWEAGVGMVEQGLGMDKFQKEGLGFHYLANRNRHGAGYSYENSISGHDSWLVKTKPICGWNGKDDFHFTINNCTFHLSFTSLLLGNECLECVSRIPMYRNVWISSKHALVETKTVAIWSSNKFTHLWRNHLGRKMLTDFTYYYGASLIMVRKFTLCIR